VADRWILSAGLIPFFGRRMESLYLRLLFLVADKWKLFMDRFSLEADRFSAEVVIANFFLKSANR
jgi:hypothetical protein